MSWDIGAVFNGKDMNEIVGYPNYGYEDGKVWNTKRNKPLKGYVHYSVEYVNLCNKGKVKLYPVPKVAFCAIHHIPIEAVPKGMQFIINDDGSIRLGSATERNIKRGKTLAKFKQTSIEKIDKEIEWLQLQKAFLQGEDVKSDIFVYLTEIAKEIEPYILKVTKSKVMPSLAKDYLLESVDLCYQKVVSKNILIQSPRKWLSFATRNFVNDKEKAIKLRNI